MPTTQREIISRMTVEEKLNAASMLFYSAFELKLAAVRKFHPELSESDIRKKVREAFLYAG